MIEDGGMFTPSWTVHLSLQEVNDEDERDKLNREFNKFFNYNDSPLPLDKLRRIKLIIDE